MDYTSRVMGHSFSAYEYLQYLTSRWWHCLAACAAAAAIAFAGSSLIGRKYSATATILIQPGAGADPRASINVSPAYIESLKAYEYLASSDSLFAQVVERFRLRAVAPDVPIEALKRRVLRVSKLPGTRILRITVTLPDPRQAAEVAAFLASETVKRSDEARSVLPAPRGEQLRLIDSGVVPEQPSSPNVALNVVAATLLAFIVSIVYLSASFTFQRMAASEAASARTGHGAGA